MPDVFFITNRDLVGPASLPASYTGTLTEGRLRTGIAQVSPANIDTLEDGAIQGIRAAGEDAFTATAAAELSRAKNLLFFIHGFANAFPDAITRAAFNRDWFASSGVAAADCTIVTFTWPSPGITVTVENAFAAAFFLPFTALISPALGRLVTPAARDYLEDQKRAADSANGLVSAFDRLDPVLKAVRKKGGKTFIMAHSMGHQLLAFALGRPQAPTSTIFDEAFLTAADCEAVPKGAPPAWIKTLQAIAQRVHVYSSQADDILKVSQGVNGHERLGQRGETGLELPKAKTLRLVDCTNTKGLDSSQAGIQGHYYYRRVPVVRDDIAAAMAGGGKAGASVLPPG